MLHQRLGVEVGRVQRLALGGLEARVLAARAARVAVEQRLVDIDEYRDVGFGEAPGELAARKLAHADARRRLERQRHLARLRRILRPVEAEAHRQRRRVESAGAHLADQLGRRLGGELAAGHHLAIARLHGEARQLLALLAGEDFGVALAELGDLGGVRSLEARLEREITRGDHLIGHFDRIGAREERHAEMVVLRERGRCVAHINLRHVAERAVERNEALAAQRVVDRDRQRAIGLERHAGGRDDADHVGPFGERQRLRAEGLEQLDRLVHARFVRRVDRGLEPREQRLVLLGVVPEIRAVLSPVARGVVGLVLVQQLCQHLLVRGADGGERRNLRRRARAQGEQRDHRERSADPRHGPPFQLLGSRRPCGCSRYDTPAASCAVSFPARLVAPAIPFPACRAPCAVHPGLRAVP